jgi:hypothetical protein
VLICKLCRLKVVDVKMRLSAARQVCKEKMGFYEWQFGRLVEKILKEIDGFLVRMEEKDAAIFNDEHKFKALLNQMLEQLDIAGVRLCVYMCILRACTQGSEWRSLPPR